MATMTASTSAVRSNSALVCPIRMAERAIGSERNRSTAVVPRSAARPLAVDIAPNATDIPKSPGIRKSM
jgi:hypothetical protein